ncbi:tellurite resistance TerB family protein [Microvirga sp. 2TAF3]|uniref:tellurite resistance TerB family protein n=1 Tax=Microvirga sp. 2TAF3 TaxID=3233014 RepID=UPI003F99A919
MNLGSILEGLLNSQGNARGQTPPDGQQPQQGGLGDLQGNLGDLASRIPGGMGGLAGGGALLSMILGSSAGRSAGGSLLKAGGLAVLSAVAFKAYQDWQNKQAPGASGQAGLPAQVPAGSGFHLGEEKDRNGREMGVALVQAMISAAKSDGHLDGEESSRIQNQIQQLGLGGEEKGFLMDAMGKPADAASIAGLASSREQAAELYVASLMAIGSPDTPEEKTYLNQLANQLQLPPDLVAHLDAQVGAARKAIA